MVSTTTIWRGFDSIEGKGWRNVCCCGWRGPWFTTSKPLAADRREHEATCRFDWTEPDDG